MASDDDRFVPATGNGNSRNRGVGTAVDPRTFTWITAGKLKRAERRLNEATVWIDENGSAVVDGISQLGDHYDEYFVTFDPRTRRHTCSCGSHVGGEYRTFCTHTLAVMMWKFDNKPKNSKVAAVVEAEVAPKKRRKKKVPAPATTRPASTPVEPLAPELTPLRPPPTTPLDLPPATSTTSSSTSTHPVTGSSDLVLPSWASTLRTGQLDAAQQVVEAWQRDIKLVFLDGPTGTGKTLIAYLALQLLRDIEEDATMLHVSDTKSLQDQFCGDFGELNAQTIKGRANYVPLYPFDEDGIPLDLSCDDCDLSKATKSCSWCLDQPDDCSYVVQKQAAVDSQMAVLNYAYFLREANSSGSKFSGREMVVLDECDVLEKIMLGFVEVTFSASRRQRMGLGQPKTLDSPDAQVEWLQETVVPKVGVELHEQRQRARNAKSKKELIRFRRSIRNLVGLERNTKNLIEEIPDDNWVLTGYDKKRGRGEKAGPLTFKPIRIMPSHSELLFKHSNRFLAMSATIISADELTDTLGWTDDHEVVSVPMTFPVARRRVYQIPVCAVTHKLYKEAVPQLTAATATIVDTYPTVRTVVHTVSYRLAGDLHEGLKGDDRVDADRLFQYRSAAERDAVIAAWLDCPSGVLLGPSLGRGFDFAHDAARVNIITKIPYPYLGDKQVNARLYSPGGREWYIVQAVRSLVQATGRVVRADDDWGVTYVIDSEAMKIYNKHGTLFPQWWKDAVTTSVRRAELLEGKLSPMPVEPIELPVELSV